MRWSLEDARRLRSNIGSWQTDGDGRLEAGVTDGHGWNGGGRDRVPAGLEVSRNVWRTGGSDDRRNEGGTGSMSEGLEDGDRRSELHWPNDQQLGYHDLRCDP